MKAAQKVGKGLSRLFTGKKQEQGAPVIDLEDLLCYSNVRSIDRTSSCKTRMNNMRHICRSLFRLLF